MADPRVQAFYEQEDKKTRGRRAERGSALDTGTAASRLQDNVARQAEEATVDDFYFQPARRPFIGGMAWAGAIGATSAAAQVQRKRLRSRSGDGSSAASAIVVDDMCSSDSEAPCDPAHGSVDTVDSAGNEEGHSDVALAVDGEIANGEGDDDVQEEDDGTTDDKRVKREEEDEEEDE